MKSNGLKRLTSTIQDYM